MTIYPKHMKVTFTTIVFPVNSDSLIFLSMSHMSPSGQMDSNKTLGP